MEGGKEEKGIVCVTGGAGYIGSWLIMRLLDRGYTVRATVRLDPGLNRDISHLTSLPGASEKLQIFNADLKNPQSFDAAIDGCVGVFLVAYPVNLEQIEVDDAANEMFVEGTLELLKACLKSKTVKRVVYTSSTAAIVANNKGLMEMDESSWSDVEFCRTVKARGSSYIIPKTLIEQATLKFAEENGLDLVSIIPSMVVGPFICPHLPVSISLALALILGNRYQYFPTSQMVHIDDIVSGHIFLFECPNAKGRYICSSAETSIHDLAKFLSIHYPEFEMPMNLLSEMKEQKPVHLSPNKLRSLGFKFKYDMKEMFDGAIQCCKEKGFLEGVLRDMEGRSEKGIVCVTGGAGYIGSWLIMRLLERGYTVRTTVRLDPGLNRDISYLTSLPGASEKLQIFNADLNKPNSFDAAIDGCDGVFHVAYPVNFEENEADDAMTKKIVESTIDILKACLKSKTVKKVVYTSTAAAVLVNNKGLMEMDESSWTDVDFCRAVKFIGSSYIIPKTLIEQAALKFGEENGLDLVTIIPSMVVGPFICPHLPSSVCLAMSLILGKHDRYQYMPTAQMVHIDDIVSGHIFLFECPDAKGRYICSTVETSIHDLAKFLSIQYPEFEMPMNLLSEIKEEKPIHLSPKKLISLGFKFKYDMKEMFDGAIQSCKEKGFM
ncbi:NAD-dependent epimerase/dehydratase [Macleaya cordata]|uniref:NAD-dependent epimerase/dehydratase n=1 Tax=Macleaya cordata TaxID=56857 RepID=A0A200QB28_MACCD|nr:NAD-dependent epimerase/dehydratase [Macleaya cordata]